MSPIARRIMPMAAHPASRLLERDLELDEATITGSTPQTLTNNPLFFVFIALAVSLVTMLLLALYSFWYHNHLKRQTYSLPESPPTRPASLYHRRARRKQPEKHVRWHAMPYQDSPLMTAASTTQLLPNDHSAKSPLITYIGYGATASVLNGLRLSQSYKSPMPGSFLRSPYQDAPLTATTIDSTPMSAAGLPPSPIPQRSSHRRAPPPLNLNGSPPMIEISQPQSHKKDKSLKSSGTAYDQLTPYPLSAQLTPVSAASLNEYGTSLKTSNHGTAGLRSSNAGLDSYFDNDLWNHAVQAGAPISPYSKARAQYTTT